jgi:hypothetical protein
LLRLRVEGPLRGGTPNAEPRGRGVVHHVWRGPFLIARPRGHCGCALNGSIPLASSSRMPPSRPRALTLSRFRQRDLSMPRGTVRPTSLTRLATRRLPVPSDFLQAVRVIDAGTDLRKGTCIACAPPQPSQEVSGDKEERERDKSAQSGHRKAHHCAPLGGSLCVSSGHRSSTTARISSEI